MVKINFLLVIVILCVVDTEEFRREYNRLSYSQYANVAQYPFMVLLLANENEQPSMCGASLIELGLVLTAARCVENINPGDIVLLAGEVDYNPYMAALKIRNMSWYDNSTLNGNSTWNYNSTLNGNSTWNDNSTLNGNSTWNGNSTLNGNFTWNNSYNNETSVTYQKRRAKTIHIHQKYQQDKHFNVAVVIPDFPFEETSNVQAIEVSTEKLSSTSNCIKFGFGISNTSSEESYKLKFAFTHGIKIHPDECKIPNVRNDYLYCSHADTSSMCFGDFGSPLVCNLKVLGVAYDISHPTNESCGEDTTEWYFSLHYEVMESFVAKHLTTKPSGYPEAGEDVILSNLAARPGTTLSYQRVTTIITSLVLGVYFSVSRT